MDSKTIELMVCTSALVKELSKHITGLAIDIERVQSQGPWGRKQAEAMQRDIDRAEAVQFRAIDAMTAMALTVESGNP